MPAVLIDTDIAIDFLRGVSYAQPLLGGLWSSGQAMISVLTVYELTAGMRDAEKVVTHNLFQGVCRICFSVARRFARGNQLCC